MSHWKLRDYQIQGAREIAERLHRDKLVYLIWDVRTGKTATALAGVANFLAKSESKKAIFLTKKGAIGDRNKGAVADYYNFGIDKYVEVLFINDESIHKIPEEWVRDCDVVIHDEHHRFAGYPKMSTRAMDYRRKFAHKPQVWLSGTPCPESYTQMYNQFRVSAYGPWNLYTNFYAWARKYVKRRLVEEKQDDGSIRMVEKYIQKMINGNMTNDYSHGLKDLILADTDKYCMYRTQQDSGFVGKIEERFIHVKMEDSTYALVEQLKSDQVVEFSELDDVIIADTGAKMKQKLHQLYSGSIKLESGEYHVFDYSKCKEIERTFSDKKIVIFYKYKAELKAVKEYFGDKVTEDEKVFDSDPEKWMVIQIQSGREGRNFSKADFLVFYNIDFSATSYWQGRDRMTTMDRKENIVYWICSLNGIEDKIYKSVVRKKSYTTSVFKRDFKIK